MLLEISSAVVLGFRSEQSFGEITKPIDYFEQDTKAIYMSPFSYSVSGMHRNAVHVPQRTNKKEWQTTYLVLG